MTNFYIVVLVLFVGMIVYSRLRNPNKMAEYIPKAQKVVGQETVIAACLMAVKDAYGEVVWGMLKKSFWPELGADLMFGHTVGGVVGGYTGIQGMHEAREANAERQGLTPVVMVAVTDERIYVLGWDRPKGVYLATTETSIEATEILRIFTRATTKTKCDVKLFLNTFYIGDSATGEFVALQATLSPASQEAKTGKAVKSLLVANN
jgi:hypothetical protein